MLSEYIFDISSLNKWNKLRLECAITAQYIETYNCSKCLNTIKSNPKSMRKLQETKGCFANQKKEVAYFDSGTKLFMCPGRMYGIDETNLIHEYHIFEKTGLLPKPGSLYYQDSKTIESFNFIQYEIQKNEIIIAKKQEEELKAKNKRR